MDPTRNQTCLDDSTFGPVVVGCRGDFDFTVLFEQVIFSIVPSSIFILLGIPRLVTLRKRVVILKGRSLQLVKATTATIYIGLQLAQLVLTAHDSTRQETELPEAALFLCAAILVLFLSLYEHSHSLRPSTLLSTYLLVSLLLDAAQLRTKWLSGPHSAYTKVLSASTAMKAALVTLETWEKKAWLPTDDLPSPEATSGIINRGFLYWLNGLVIRGYRSPLTVPDLYSLDAKLSAQQCHSLFQARWSKHGDGHDGSLVTTLAQTLRGPLLAPILPRILLGATTFTQPFYISAVLTYLQSDPATTPRSHGYGLIAAAALIYTSMTLFSTLYRHLHTRAMAQLRAILVLSIYEKTTRLPSTAEEVDESAALTLMNADVERIKSGLADLHEFWASVVETGLAAWLLQRQLGAAFVAPIVVVLVCTLLTLGVARFSGRRQAEWMRLQQRRVGLTASVVPRLVAVEMAGLAHQVGRLVQACRVAELAGASRWFVLGSTTAGVAYAPLLLSPAFAFAVSGREMGVQRVFTSLAWIHMLSGPMPMVLQTVPLVQSALASLKRVEAFLKLDEHEDPRGILPEDVGQEVPMVVVRDGKFGWKADEWMLKDVNLELQRGSLTMVVGTVASSKSTFAKALLGEVPFHGGQVLIRPAVLKEGTSYCDQEPVITNGTIRENILGFETFNANWYEEVVRACQLSQDFGALPDGDQSLVGSKGQTLSGGQRKRVALARALYSKLKLSVLDDVLSGLDARTEEAVARAVFGPGGILRRLGTTAVLCSQSLKYASFVDQVVLLRDGKLFFSGPPARLESSGSSLLGEHSTTSSPQTVENEAPESFAAMPPRQAEAQQPLPDSRRVGTVSEHKFYLSTIGPLILIPWTMLGIIFAFLFNFGNVWLQFWANDNEDPETSNHSSSFYLGIYFLIEGVCASLMAAFAGYSGCVMTPLASKALHLRALKTLLRAPLAYLSKTDAAVVTGYFAQDMNIIDLNLSFGLSNTVLTGLTVAGKAAVVGVASPWVLIAYPVLAGVLFMIQRVYLRTSTQLRFLIMEAKDPLYKHFMETTSSLQTLRAFSWITPQTTLASSLIDTSQRPAYLLAMLTQWLSTVLNMSVAVVAVLFVSLATQLRTNAGFTGVGLVSLMSFAQMLGDTIRNYAELQTSMAALARLKAFEDGAADEGDREGGGVALEGTWPDRGVLRLSGVYASYGRSDGEEEGEAVLKNVSLEIEAGKKVLVCGRTGSGKSTLLLLMQGFLTPEKGSIRIDDVPLDSIPRTTLCNRIIALPQSPFFFPGGYTARQNLEFHGEDGAFAWTQDQPIAPSRQIQDEDCEYALRRVNLWHLVATRGGLDAEMREDSLSKGERQLFSLARAVVRARQRRRKSGSEDAAAQGGILLLDEVNTGLDDDAERLMWEVIGGEFGGYTVICIAHGLAGVDHCDTVVLLQAGEVAEAGTPSDLLGRKGGRFKELWERGGSLGRS